MITNIWSGLKGSSIKYKMSETDLATFFGDIKRGCGQIANRNELGLAKRVLS